MRTARGIWASAKRQGFAPSGRYATDNTHICDTLGTAPDLADTSARETVRRAASFPADELNQIRRSSRQQRMHPTLRL